MSKHTDKLRRNVEKMLPQSITLNRPCPRCGTQPARDCGYLEYDGEEYDCSAPDLDEVNPSTLCDDCPHVWCEQCKQETN